MAIVPKKRFVAFIDILGVSRYTKDEALADKYVRALYRVVSTILRNEGFYEFQHVHGDHRIEFELRRPADKKANLTAVSDALVISVPEISDANEVHGRSRLLQILSILETISHLQYTLAGIGLLSRGGLACGSVIHTKKCRCRCRSGEGIQY